MALPASPRHFLSNNRRDIVLFLVLLFTMILFVHVYGWNEYSRMDLTKAMVNDHSLAITPYHNNTGDKILFQNEYYSDKPPISSLIGIPAYLLSKPYTPASQEPYRSGNDFEENTVYTPAVSHTLFHLLFILFTASIPGALLVVLIKRRVEQEYSPGVGLFTAASFGIGTLLFIYSVVAAGVILATLFIYLSYIFVLDRSSSPNRKMAVSGICGGLAVSTEYYAAVIPFILFLYLLYTERLQARWYVVGGVIGILPLALYNFAISGAHPLLLYAFQTAGTGGPPGTTPTVMPTPPISILGVALGQLARLTVNSLKLLIYPVRGLLFYSPVLLLAFIGMYQLQTNDRRQHIVLPLVCFVSALLFNAWLAMWWGGSSYGPRYLVPALPLLALPFAHTIQDIRTRQAATILLPLSIFQTLVGSRGPIAAQTTGMARDIGIALGHLTPLEAGVWRLQLSDISLWLYPHSWTNYAAHAGEFLSEGPPFLLVTTLLSGFSWDIRLGAPHRIPDPLLWISDAGATSYGFNWMIFSLLIGAGSLLFSRELRTLWRSHDHGKTIILLIALILLILPLQTSDAAYHPGENWHQQQPGELFHWAGTDPSLYVYGSWGKDILQYTLRSMNHTRTVTLTINNRPHQQLQVPTTVTDYTIRADLRPGRNHLHLNTHQQCTPIQAADNTTMDRRCVTIGLANLTHISPPTDSVVPGANTYLQQDTYRLRRNATLYSTGSGQYTLSLRAKSIGGPTRVRIYKNDVLLAESRVDGFGGPITTPVFTMDGATVFTFQTGCPDTCELINVSDLTLQPFEEQPTDLLYQFGHNWYRNATGEIAQWSSGNATIYVYNYRDRPVDRVAWLRGTSFIAPQNISLYWNGEHVTARHGGEKYGFNVTLQPGENVLKINAPTSCTGLGELNNNDDIRCVLFGFKAFYLLEDW